MTKVRGQRAGGAHAGADAPAARLPTDRARAPPPARAAPPPHPAAL